MPLEIAFENDPDFGDAVIVRLRGTLEVNTAHELWEKVSERVGTDTRFFVFDFSRVNILTSAGVGMLVRLFIRLRGVGGAVIIHSCTDKVREIFTVVMLESVLRVCSTPAQAHQRLRELASA
jgi:anti-anti-sigma factor